MHHIILCKKIMMISDTYIVTVNYGVPLMPTITDFASRSKDEMQSINKNHHEIYT